MSGIASRIAWMLEPDANAIMPSPQPGTTCIAGWFNKAFMAAAYGRIAVSPDCWSHDRGLRSGRQLRSTPAIVTALPPVVPLFLL